MIHSVSSVLRRGRHRGREPAASAFVNSPGSTREWNNLRCLLVAVLLVPAALSAQDRAPTLPFTNPPVVLTVEGTNVFIQRFRSNLWESAYPNQVLAAKD